MIIYRSMFALTSAVVGLGTAHAGIVINGTRVVYPAGHREVALSMVNNDKEARLVQAWVDDGDAKEEPEKSNAPFIITPPMARVDPGKGQTLRIVFTGATVPADRESVFYLNVLEIPPKPTGHADGDMNYLQMAVRSRLKIFFRPEGLPGSPDGAVGQLHWRLLKRDSGYAMECTNDSAYNVSFSDVSFKNAKPDDLVAKGGMCPAKGKEIFAMVGSPADSNNTLELTTVNDFGGFDPHEASFTL
nr:fimbria/pilus periplasmic chaperone [Dyella sp. ASV24]